MSCQGQSWKFHSHRIPFFMVSLRVHQKDDDPIIKGRWRLT